MNAGTRTGTDAPRPEPTRSSGSLSIWPCSSRCCTCLPVSARPRSTSATCTRTRAFRRRDRRIRTTSSCVARDVAGLDFVALTDHDAFLTETSGRSCTTDRGIVPRAGRFVAFSAVEWTHRWHMNAIFERDDEPYCAARGLPGGGRLLRVLRPRVPDGEAAAHVNHPADSSRSTGSRSTTRSRPASRSGIRPVPATTSPASATRCGRCARASASVWSVSRTTTTPTASAVARHRPHRLPCRCADARGSPGIPARSALLRDQRRTHRAGHDRRGNTDGRRSPRHGSAIACQYTSRSAPRRLRSRSSSWSTATSSGASAARRRSVTSTATSASPSRAPSSMRASSSPATSARGAVRSGCTASAARAARAA